MLGSPPGLQHAKERNMYTSRIPAAARVADAEAQKTVVDVQAEAREDARDAQYQLVLAKCAAMASPIKRTA
jgi:hypothetical protein